MSTLVILSIAGAMIGATHRLPFLVPLQILSLAIMLLMLPKGVDGLKGFMRGGCVVGLGYIAVRLFGVGVTLPVWFILLFVGVSYFVLAAAGWHWFSKLPPLRGALAFAAWCCILEWLNFTCLPLFGTAQTFVVPWSHWPEAIQFISTTGLLGLTFAVCWLASLLSCAVACPVARKTAISSVLLTLILLATVGWSNWNPPSPQTVRVGVVGYIASATRDHDRDFFRHYLETASGRVRLLAFPELAVTFADSRARSRLLGQLQQDCRRCRTGLIFSYFDVSRQGNFAIFISAAGTVLGEYQKTHLVPGLENYQAGNGMPLIVEQDGVKVSIMICQDDNFTDVSRRISQLGVQMIVVPTFDWKSVAHMHFQNSILRAIESNCAIVRSTSGGISAIVSPRGRVLQALDHHEPGNSPKMIVAEVPVGRGHTLYAQFGDWPMLALSLAALLWARLYGSEF